MEALSAIWPQTLDHSFPPTEGTTLARFAGKARSKPRAPVHISAALLIFPVACHISASYSNSDMISLDKHDMNFPQQVINYRKEFWFYEQGVDGSPLSGETREGF